MATLQQLLRDLRDDLDDDVAPYHYSDKKLTRWLNQAVEEAAVRGRMLLESNRADICKIALQAGTADYALHPCAWIIRRAVLDGDLSDPLYRTTTHDMDRRGGRSWRTQTGTPQCLIRDQQAGRILLFPIPDRDSILHLTVIRTPDESEQLEQLDDEPVIDPIHHRGLINWALWRAYSVKDSEQLDPSAAQANLALFEQAFGRRPSADQIRHLAIDAGPGVVEHWF